MDFTVDLSKLSQYLVKLKDWSTDSFLGPAAWPGGGGALPTSSGTGDCIGLSHVISSYSRGRDLHGFLFLALGCSLRIYLLTLLLSVGPSWSIT